MPHDIFISYRHLDNEAPAGERGWVSEFTERLRIQLGSNLGREPDIWRDPTIQGGQYFADVIMNHLAQSKVLISILSPGYVNPDSPWCMRELNEFCRLAERAGGVRVGDRSRCVKVVKTFLPRERHPGELQGLLGYEFFGEDPETGRPRAFSHVPEGHLHRRYLDKIDDLARDLAELLNDIDGAKPLTPPPDPERTVYLAETTSDRAENRDQIKNELLSRGFYVLPDRELPETAAEYRAEVRENLRRSRLAVHLIGERYGNTLAGEAEKSVALMQNELAAERKGEDASFARIIWIPPGLQPSSDYQSKFVQLIRTDAAAQLGAEVLERSFEELKNRIIEKLTAPPPLPVRPDFAGEEEFVRVYLMYDKLDYEAALAVRDYLMARQYDVVLTAKGGDETQVIQFHKENLLECDAALIYYGHGNEFWLHSKLSDLRKAAGWGRARTMLCKAIYFAAPENEHKRDYRTLQAVLLAPPGYGGLSEAALEQFIADIESRRGGQARTGSGGS